MGVLVGATLTPGGPAVRRLARLISVYRNLSVWAGNRLAITGLSALVTSRVKIGDECWKSRPLMPKSVNLPGLTKSILTTAGADGAVLEAGRSSPVAQPKVPMRIPSPQIA
jgi:hypothetical protein